jgi:hypothetical protein
MTARTPIIFWLVMISAIVINVTAAVAGALGL